MVTVSKKKNGPTGEIAAFAKKSQQLRLEADVLFAKGDLGGALNMYNRAQQLALRDSVEFVAIAANKAAVHLKAQNPTAAVRECDLALEIQSDFKPALLRRATGYEKFQEYAKAKADIERALTLDPSDESVKSRLDKIRGLADQTKRAGRPAGLGGGGVGRQNNTQKYTKEQIATIREQFIRQQQAANQTKFTFSVTHEGETKTIQLPVSLRYNDLTEAIRKEFGTEHHVKLKYKDFDGDMITITSRMDLRAALTNFATIADQEAKEKNEKKETEIPVIHVTAFVSDVKVEETPEQVQPQELQENDEYNEDVIEIDEWLLSFATLFRKVLGDEVPKDGPLELRSVGLERCCEVLEKTVAMPEAHGLLTAASEKFQEAAATAVFNWGNVYVCNSRRIVDSCSTPDEDGASSSDEALAEAAKKHITALDADYEACCERFTAALEIKPTYFEAPITWGQQAFERGKLYHQLSKQVGASEKKSAAEKISDEMFALAITKYQDAMGMLSPAERDAILTEQSEESNGVKAQILILWGNVLYEKSQVKHARAMDDWKDDVDAAVAKFNEAGCAKGDIVRALVNHSSEAWKTEEEATEVAGRGN
jgi:tetratricopeptide (TPR) repeat protein